MSLLGDILLAHYGGAEGYFNRTSADEAIIAAVEELEKCADEQPDLVARVEMAMIKAGNVGIPYAKVDEYRQINEQLREEG